MLAGPDPMGEHSRGAVKGMAYREGQKTRGTRPYVRAAFNPGGAQLRRVPAAGGTTRLVWVKPDAPDAVKPDVAAGDLRATSGDLAVSPDDGDVTSRPPDKEP